MTFVEDGHWFQSCTAILWLLSSIISFYNYKFKYPWFIGSVFLFLFAVDEYFYIHECLKVSLFKGHHAAYFQDYMIFFYFVASLVGFCAFYRYSKNNRIYGKSILILCLILTSAITSLDVFGLSFRNDQETEEVLEFSCALLVLLFIWLNRYNKISFKFIYVGASVLFIFFCSGWVMEKHVREKKCLLPKTIFFNRL